MTALDESIIKTLAVADLATLAERRPELAGDCDIIRANLRLLAVRAKDTAFCRIVAEQIARLGKKMC